MIRLAEASTPTAALPDMTALLDIITLMLIFLILIAHPATQVLSVDLPQAQSAEAAAPADKDRILVLHADAWEWDGQRYREWTQLERVLGASLQQSPDTALRIQGAGDAPMQRLVQALDYARRHGIAVADLEVARTQP